MRTGFAGAGEIAGLSEAYKGNPANFVGRYLQENAGKESIDPAKAAARIVEAVEETGPTKKGGTGDLMRIPLGREAGVALAERAQLLEGARDRRSLWSSAELPEA